MRVFVPEESIMVTTTYYITSYWRIWSGYKHTSLIPLAYILFTVNLNSEIQNIHLYLSHILPLDQGFLTWGKFTPKG